MSAVSLSDPQSLNLYAYCGNDPLNHTDPQGLFFKKLFGTIGKIIKWVTIAVAVAVTILTITALFSLQMFVLLARLYILRNIVFSHKEKVQTWKGILGKSAVDVLAASSGSQRLTNKQRNQLPRKECEGLLRQIYNRAVELYKRRVDFIVDRLNLRILGNRDSKGGDLAGHIDQYDAKAKNLKSLLKDYKSGNFGGRGGTKSEGDIIEYARLMLILPVEYPKPRFDPDYQKPAYPEIPPEYDNLTLYFYPMGPVTPGRLPVRLPTIPLRPLFVP
jgi:hypothetical protein